MELHDQARRILGLLNAAGYKAYVVGGYVRDSLLGRECHDIDIATDAHCDQMKALFEAEGLAVYDTGIAHGTITVACEDMSFEVTTFRVDGSYLDHRHPDEVSFTRCLEDDLARRDFTINAMGYHPEEGIIDPFGGQADIEARRVRCVGDSRERFKEDALRMLRALRFASQLDFTIEHNTAQAMRVCATLLHDVSWERIGSEFVEMICGVGAKRVLLGNVDVIGIVVPELLPMKSFWQNNPHHIYDVLEHTAVAVDVIAPQPKLRLAALFHDSGKPSTYSLGEDGRGHFYGHPSKSADIARVALTRLRIPQHLVEEVVVIVANHDARLEPTKKCVKRWFGKLGKEAFFDLLEMKRADVRALRPEDTALCLPLFDQLDELAREILEENECFTLSQMALNGNDLLGMGFSEGPQLGEVLDILLEQTISGKVENNRDELLVLAAQLKIIAQLPTGFVISTEFPELHIELANNHFAQMLGYHNYADFSKRFSGTLFDFVHPADYLRLRRAFVDHGSSTKPLTVSYRILCQNGGCLWVQHDYRHIVWRDGSKTTMSFYSDITYQVQTNLELEETNRQSLLKQQHYDSLINRIPSAIALYEYDHGTMRTCFVNDSMCRLFGITDEQRNNLEAFSLAHPDDVAALRNEMEQALLEGRDVDIIFRATPQDEAPIWVHLVASHEVQENGLPLFFALFNNITKERQALDLEQALGQANEVSAARGAFVAQVSHEMRTPLNAVMGLLDLMQDCELSELPDYLRKARVSANHLADLVNDILDFSRIDQGKLALIETFIACQDIVDRLDAIIGPQAYTKKIDFAIVAETFLYKYVRVDIVRLEQICINLLSNAIKYTDLGGKVRLYIWCKNAGDEKQEMTFIVNDTGIGMSPAMLMNATEPFAQDTEKRRPRGSGPGLGLAIVKELVDLMGGTFQLESNEGAGTTATFTLTVTAKSVLDDDELDEAESNAVAAIDYDFSGKHVLLVDDHEINLLVARNQLGNMGIIVDIAMDGEQAVERFETSPVGYYDVVLMDVTMVGMDGFEATRIIRSLSRDDAKTVPIVALTAHAFAEDVRKSLESGMNFHLSKPIDADRLKQVLSNVLH